MKACPPSGSKGGHFILWAPDHSSSFLRQVEVDQRSPEASRFPSTESDSHCQPDDTSNLRRSTEPQPKGQADEKTREWRHQVQKRPLVLTQKVVHKRR